MDGVSVLPGASNGLKEDEMVCRGPPTPLSSSPLDS